jgi:hypothetical protein
MAPAPSCPPSPLHPPSPPSLDCGAARRKSPRASRQGRRRILGEKSPRRRSTGRTGWGGFL